MNEITKTDTTEGNVWVDDQGLVCVAWEGTAQEVDKYPSVWLRDNCQCPDCFDPSSRQRKLLLRNLDADIQPVSTTFHPDTNEVGHNFFGYIIELYLDFYLHFFSKYSILL